MIPALRVGGCWRGLDARLQGPSVEFEKQFIGNASNSVPGIFVFMCTLRPADTWLRVLLRHIAPQGFDYVGVLLKALLVAILGIAVRIWRYIFCKYMTWPYRCALLTDAVRATRVKTSDALYQASECCLDRGFSLKLRRLRSTAALLLAFTAAMVAIRMWVLKKSLGNMICERILALFRKSAALRCFVERILGAGFLTQLLQAHRAAGGDDPRKLVRKTLVDLGVPLQAKRSRKKVPKGQVPKHIEFSNALCKGTKFRDRADYKEALSSIREALQECGSLPLPPSDIDPIGVGNHDAGGATYNDRIGRTLWGHSNESSPIVPSVLEAEARRRAPCSRDAAGSSIGLTDRMEGVRREYLKHRQSRDVGCHSPI